MCKLKCVGRLLQVVEMAVQTSYFKHKDVGADDTWPLIINVFLKNFPKMLQTNLYFLEMFMKPGNKNNQVGANMTNLQMAIQFLETITHKSLSIDKFTFQKNIFQKEVDTGILFMNKRQRSERTLLTLQPNQAC